MSFPFNEVYALIADSLLSVGLDKEETPPTIMRVGVVDNKPVHCSICPKDIAEEIYTFFASLIDTRHKLNEHTLIGAALLRKKMSKVLTKDECFVMVTEVYQRAVETKSQLLTSLEIDLSEDPEAQEGLLITIYRPEGERMGLLPILKGRRLTYGPLIKATNIAVKAVAPKDSNSDSNSAPTYH